jgi:hypothetical protein
VARRRGLQALVCKRCRHRWVPRIADVRICADDGEALEVTASVIQK